MTSFVYASICQVVLQQLTSYVLNIQRTSQFIHSVKVPEYSALFPCLLTGYDLSPFIKWGLRSMSISLVL